MRKYTERTQKRPTERPVHLSGPGPRAVADVLVECHYSPITVKYVLLKVGIHSKKRCVLLNTSTPLFCSQPFSSQKDTLL